MSMIEYFFNIFSTSNLKNLFPFSEIMPLIFIEILYLSRIISNSLVVNIFIIYIRCSASPCKIITHSNRQWWQSIRCYSKFTIEYFIIVVEKNGFKAVKDGWNQTREMRITSKNRLTMSSMISSNNPAIRPRTLHSKLHRREVNRSDSDIIGLPIFLQNFNLLFYIVLFILTCFL